MTVPFNRIPSDLRVPFFYAEVDPSLAGRAQITKRTLLIGQKLTAGTAPANAPVYCAGRDAAVALFGMGSILVDMVDAYRRVDPIGEVWCVPVADDAAGVAATATITVSAGATASGTLWLYIAGRLVKVGLAGGEAPAAAATLIAAAINAAIDLPVTAAAAAAVVTLTARHKGTLGNDIDVRFNHRGQAGGEAFPAGFAAAIVAMANGATDPSIQAALDALGDEPFDFIAQPYTDGATLDALQAFMNEATGRWSWQRMLWGGVFSAKRGTVASLLTFGAGRNDPHMTVLGFNHSPSPVWRWASAYCAAAAVSLKIDPARPVHTLALTGILAPPVGPGRFTISERNSLLFSGVATFEVGPDGEVRISRAVSTFRVNQYGQADTAWLDIETPYTLMEILRRMQDTITRTFGRHKLANNGTRFAAGAAIVTPNIIKAHLLAEYGRMEEDGLVENFDAFKDALRVERATGDPNRVDALFPPDLINQLRVFAMLAQFRLQYPTAA